MYKVCVFRRALKKSAMSQLFIQNCRFKVCSFSEQYRFAGLYTKYSGESVEHWRKVVL